ncbi:sigma-70 family RNA polymerase sigma factor [Mangrovivirga sp. M17]|uniref:RNA polymerase sigma factor n=1 Tax=Mangrovivirga halotolerans TaxID=2993936 RepID=A0ABT3RNH2_9BACT|nr:sigma-70 family RNA polymerase sigma factor [Mangrovivirga halotolerans]MCX2743360.1 sigma-70 family RNA polymerase sigma factor [Mangrovivirga halotolerans]
MSKELVRNAKKGDVKALNTLIDNHKDFAFSIALKFLKNKSDAEDVVQNSFITVLKSISTFRNEAKFSTWLYKIVYHECLKAMKSDKNLVEYIPQYIREEKIEDEQEEPVDIGELLESLQANEYAVISLFYLKEKSIREITQITSMSQSNIKVILHRSRKKLKEYYYQKTE